MLHDPKALKAVLPFVSTDASCPALNGVRVRGTELAASDGHRAIIVEAKAPIEGPWPNLEQVLPKTEPKITVHVNASYLAEACKGADHSPRGRGDPQGHGARDAASQDGEVGTTEGARDAPLIIRLIERVIE